MRQMEKYVVIKKLFNEKAIVKMTKNQVWIKTVRGVNSRWIFESAKELAKSMKVNLSIG